MSHPSFLKVKRSDASHCPPDCGAEPEAAGDRPRHGLGGWLTGWIFSYLLMIWLLPYLKITTSNICCTMISYRTYYLRYGRYLPTHCGTLNWSSRSSIFFIIVVCVNCIILLYTTRSVILYVVLTSMVYFCGFMTQQTQKDFASAKGTSNTRKNNFAKLFLLAFIKFWNWC